MVVKRYRCGGRSQDEEEESLWGGRADYKCT